MQGFPSVEPGLTIGLLGGSFDPPHEGHVHITKLALKFFNLSKIWWLVCPENPIKSVTPSDVNSRFLASKKIMKHPSVVITDLERKFKTKYTFQTLIKLKKLYPSTKFVWLMGADNLINFTSLEKLGLDNEKYSSWCFSKTRGTNQSRIISYCH